MNPILRDKHRAVTNYKPRENETTTVVVADDTCSKKDVEEIKMTCEKLDYVYEGRLHEDYAQTNIGPGAFRNGDVFFYSLKECSNFVSKEPNQHWYQLQVQ
ncbi:hypothetical protein HID58_057772 [Brassica napus]|uniref:Uncharacterized protein n=1 Tax=Brassica napus TaxID=3708 RepID=A0ABQ7XHW7_BRANA|nr:hypothetical protein HID58_057772 [Brassica napus]